MPFQNKDMKELMLGFLYLLILLPLQKIKQKKPIAGQLHLVF